MPSIIRKWGNSLAVRIPRALAEQVHLKQGTEVELAAADGVLTIRPRPRRRHTLAELLAKAKGPNPHGEFDRRGPVGRELI